MALTTVHPIEKEYSATFVLDVELGFHLQLSTIAIFKRNVT